MAPDNRDADEREPISFPMNERHGANGRFRSSSRKRIPYRFTLVVIVSVFVFMVFALESPLLFVFAAFGVVQGVLIVSVVWRIYKRRIFRQYVDRGREMTGVVVSLEAEENNEMYQYNITVEYSLNIDTQQPSFDSSDDDDRETSRENLKSIKYCRKVQKKLKDVSWEVYRAVDAYATTKDGESTVAGEPVALDLLILPGLARSAQIKSEVRKDCRFEWMSIDGVLVFCTVFFLFPSLVMPVLVILDGDNYEHSWRGWTSMAVAYVMLASFATIRTRQSIANTRRDATEDYLMDTIVKMEENPGDEESTVV
mmetsp:Transcript_1268/g.1848  ORF Transcript_1268/g.1848 Transcript_1268/m.1848 type:complete len:311 (+) Transcript_1268:39-971(+)